MKLVKIKQRIQRRGRGIGGRGAKSGRGMKGQKARAGYRQKAGFEGGQTPLYMRLPKGRGTKQVFASQAVKPIAINIRQIESFPAGSIVGPGRLRRAGLLTGRQMIKFIGRQPLTRNVTVRAHAISAGARASIEAAGGKVELIETRN